MNISVQSGYIQHTSPRNLKVKSENNSGTTQGKRPYRIAACGKIEGSLYAEDNSLRTLETVPVLFLPMVTVHFQNQEDKTS